MKTQAKFQCTDIRFTLNWKMQEGDKEPLGEVTLKPVYDPNPESENGRFYAATPSGEIKLGILNTEAVKCFVVGKNYIIDFTEVDN